MMPSPNPFCGKPPELSSKGRNIPVLNLGREAKLLKGQNQIVGPQDGFHVGSVGPKTSRRYFTHAVGVLELAQQKFLHTSVAVEAPNSCGREIQVGHQNSVVGVLLEGEQMPL